MADQDRDDEAPEVDQEAIQRSYEYADIPGKRVFIFLGAFTLLIVLSVLGTTGFLIWVSADNQLTTPSPRQAVVPPEPRLQAAPAKDLERLRMREDAILNSYAWVDSEAGTVRIPVKRAMDLLANHNVQLNTSATASPTWMIGAKPAFEQQQTDTVTNTTTSEQGIYLPDTGYASPGASTFGTDFSYPGEFQP